jgi:ubiquitin C-terminal hydrolase
VSPPFIVDGEMNGHGLLTNDTLELKPHGTGLGNLGNTCFMVRRTWDVRVWTYTLRALDPESLTQTNLSPQNSTLQCLAHTDPIRRYFLSGDYVKDLNRDNPLGTRGELAVEFAALLGELWTTTASLNGSNHQDYSTRSSSTVVYPRTFKHTLGRHAEQFVGYNQHDSQELAIYLLDALHEDTNKVSTKPYVEKPEKEGEETDNEAASKAWELHLKRDNSRLLSFFMGQVKSCVQCCKPGCARVSTTFDPFMYLSVPIPGSCDKTLKVTFVPLDTNIRPQVFDVTVSKSGTFKDVYAKLVSDIRESSTFSSQPPILVENLCATDVWQKEIYKWYADDDAVDMVRESDVTFVYQLTELTEIKAMEAGAAVDLEHLNMSEWTPAPHHFKLDASTHIRLGRGNDWVDEFIKYLRDNNQSLNFQRAFNPKRGDSQDRADWYNKTHRLISLAYKWLADEVPDDAQMADDSPTTAHSPLPCIAKQCCASPWFVGVQSGHDLAVLTFCLEKMRENITELEQEESFPSGAVISVRIRKPALMFASKDIVAPFVLRIPSSLTVYGLRELLAKRLGRCLRTGRACTAAGSPTPQDHASDAADLASHGGFGPPELMVTCQVPLSFERIKTSSLNRPYGVPRSSQLGSLGSESTAEGKRPNTIAVKSDSAEAECVAGLVGNQGSVFMEWPDDLFEKHFDVAEYETIDELSGSDRERTKTGSAVTSVVDCIEKYCQMEQLEESEMWYCNRCQEHVQAWKKFDLYSSPPILIVHLKRFQYSAATHRRDKIGIYIDFPLVGLDLTGLVSHWDDGEEPIYDCYAVSNHFGGLGGGHYTAYCLNDDGSWAHYDDGRITTHVDAKEVVSAAAYCLYYRRRDLPWGGDFPISLRTPVLPTPVTMNDNWIPKIDVVPSAVVARVDEEDVMDVEDDDNASRTTSAMGSMDDHADRDHFDDIDDDGCPPLLTQ